MARKANSVVTERVGGLLGWARRQLRGGGSDAIGLGVGGRVLGFLLTGALAGVLSACGDGNAVGLPNEEDLSWELVLEAVSADLGEAVIVDSVLWLPLPLLRAPNGSTEVEGPFFIEFRNGFEQALWMHYDLRFLDEDGFLLNRFIPFGQPVALPVGKIVVQEGEFLINSGQQAEDFFPPVRMQIVARVTLAVSSG
ncbi:MAG: hypothetical protein VX733_00440 [Candidatus Latescibacterota bacterium]|nr:hypothetical protein [Candidatus Latescibacterota bacterium]